MKYFALAVLLAVLQAPAPVPRKAVNNAGQPNQNQQAKRESNKTTPPEPSTTLPPNKADVPAETSADHTAHDEKKPVKVVVAPVDVNKDYADYILVLANLLLTAATFIIAIFAVVQANAAKRSADNDDRTARLTQRADVLLRDFEIRVVDGEPLIGNNTQFIVHVQNFGPSRASDVILDFGMQITGIPVTQSGNLAMPQKPPFVPIVFGAGDAKNITFPRLGTLYPPQIIAEIENGNIGLKIFGTIKYSDVFGVVYTVDCGGEYDHSMGAIVAKETTIVESKKAT